MALTGMFDGGESCSVNTAAAAGEPGGAFNWLPLVLSLQEGWRRVIGLHTAASASNATVHMCNNVHALAVRRGGAALEISDRPLLSPAWLPPLQPAVERWRTEPMRQAFGEAPSSGAPAYSYAEQAGTILCELLQQQQFRFTHAARAALEARAAQAAASVADVLTAACQGPQAATSLLQLVLDAAEAPFEGTPAL